MAVIATAGHVDHGKSTLVRALTGIEPDRWEAEKQRGLTIDLGYAWTTLASGRIASFVDVPGHSRFIGNMLAGLGPAPAVMLVVAADEGWSAQTAEHVAAVDALGITDGLLVVTRTDRGDPGPTLADVRSRLEATSLTGIPALAVSAFTGDGLPELREALDAFVARLDTRPVDARTRLWIDRSFSISGAGTVVTGTLGQGELVENQKLELTDATSRPVTVRGLQSLEQAVQRAVPSVRVAVNLRGVAADDVHRGAALLGPGEWLVTEELDVRVTGAEAVPTTAQLHVGTASVEARVRVLGDDIVRLRLAHPLPLTTGDRAMLRNPGTRRIHGLVVLDVDPPELGRRGAAKRRAVELARATGELDLAAEVARRGHLSVERARRLGADVTESVDGIRAWPETAPRLFIDEGLLRTWVGQAGEVVDAHAAANPLEPRMALGAFARRLGLPEIDLAGEVATAAKLQVGDGRVSRPGRAADLGAAETGLAELEARLKQDPFVAPTAEELAELGLQSQHLRSAVADGRLLRLADDALLTPAAPALAMRELARLPQPFTLSQARQALGTTRRVAVPLLELLDRKGWTRRVDKTQREVVR